MTSITDPKTLPSAMVSPAIQNDTDLLRNYRDRCNNSQAYNEV